MAFDVRLYRLLHRGTPGDVDFYRARCRGRSVLELGCGDGRVAIPIARAGGRVIGVELHPGMLAAAREARDALPPDVAARLDLRPGDMADFELGRRFERVIVPYTALYCLAPGPRAGCLERIASHLEPGGELLFDVWPGDELAARGPFSDREPEWIDGVMDGDTAIEVFERDVHRPGRIDVTYIHQIAEPGRMPTRESYTLTHHYLTTDALPGVLEAAGLRIVEMFGGFEGEPVDDESERLVVVARHID